VQPIIALKPGATGDITLKQGETKSQFVEWSSPRGGPYIPTPVIYGDLMYVLQGGGALAAYKVATGERLYQERLGGGAGSFSASPVAADGKIYCTSEDGDVYVVKAGPEYVQLEKNQIGEVIMATPAISDGLLIFRGLKNVYAIKP
jgi:outer membrane protein assembly factor BamB